MNKFKPGGRCGGDSGEVKKDTQGVSASYSSLMAARDAQDRSFATPALKQMVEAASPSAKPEEAIILVKKPAMDKQKIMDMILQGDMSD